MPTNIFIQRLAAINRLHLPRRTVRLRLTLLYGGLFLVSSAALLAITYVLVAHQLRGPFRTSPVPPRAIGHPVLSSGASTLPIAARELQNQQTADLHQFLVQASVALGIMAVVSIALGWIVAGRVLRPLRTVTATTREISERNLHERLAFQGPSDELKDLSDTIDGLLARLEAAFDAQRRFVANASHELRTPLTMMRTSLDVAAGKPGSVPPAVTVLASKFREGLDQADRLLENFLVLARAQQVTMTDLASVSLPAAVSAALHSRQDVIANMGIEVSQSAGAADVIGSETLLVCMVDNVIDNAVRHNERGGWIRVATEVNGAACLVVESGGAILDEKKVKDLGQPFHRLAADRTASHNGSGLGLSIVSSIVATHGGSLDLQARTGGGLRVIINLPLAVQTPRMEAGI